MIRRPALAALLALTACVAASPLPARAQTFLESVTPPLETKTERPLPPRQRSRDFVLGRDLNIVNDALVELRTAVLTPRPASALAANGANCASGQAPLGVDASGAAEGCWTPAPLGSPTFTGVPLAPTAAADTSTTQIATTAYVVGQGYAKTASPTFTGQTTIVGLTETVVAGGTCAGTYNVNPTLGTMVNLTLSGACAIGVTSLAAGHSFLIKLTQSATTAPTFTAAYRWESGTAPTWSASATKYDLVACASLDGTTLQCAAHTDLR